MKKIYLFLVALLASVSVSWAEDLTVYFDNSETNWENVYIHYWNMGGAGQTNWNSCPQLTETEVINGKACLKYVIANATVYANSGLLFKNATGETTTKTNNVEGLDIKNGIIVGQNGIISGGSGTVNYKIHGEIFGDANWSNKPMEEQADGTWMLRSEVVAGGFGIQKIENGSQTDWLNSTGDADVNDASLGNPLPVQSYGTNWASTLVGEYVFVFDPKANTLVITKPSLEKGEIYVIGTLEAGEWMPMSGAVALAETEAGSKIYTGEVSFTTTTEGYSHFSIITKKGANDSDWPTVNACRYGAASNNDLLNQLGKSYTLSKNENTYKFYGGGTYLVTVDMNGSAVTLSPIAHPEKIYMHGTFWDRHFDFADPCEAKHQGDGVYKFVSILVEAAVGEEVGYFALSSGKHEKAQSSMARVAPGALDKAGILAKMKDANIGHRYVMQGTASEVGMNAYIHGLDDESNAVYAVKPGYYDLTVNLNEDGVHQMKVEENTTITGIDNIDIEAEDAPVEYFNLQGVRVANPEGGIFIRRQGSKVSRVYVK
ncbi:MAG: hypothetical protein NC418_01745 [Muribaculaceae bacterium]|nr:hypothetical protein [Muribaculaceae bacterium]